MFMPLPPVVSPPSPHHGLREWLLVSPSVLGEIRESYIAFPDHLLFLLLTSSERLGTMSEQVPGCALCGVGGVGSVGSVGGVGQWGVGGVAQSPC